MTNKLSKPKKTRNVVWTPERRAAQAERARKTQPWKKSTGPATPAGKGTVSQNARKHGARGAEMVHLRRVLRLQRAFLKSLPD
jgi:hypothetical protein